MKQLIYLAVVLAAAASTRIAHAEEIRACKFEVKARCASGEARVTLAGGAVTAVAVDVYWCGRDQYGFSCTIDSTRGDKESV